MDSKEKCCCFFGHRDTPNGIKTRLTEAVEELISSENVKSFYVGNQGVFDRMVYSVLQEMKEKYPQIKYAVVLAYLPTDKDLKNDHACNTIYPEGLETVPKRFAISKRNEWMITKSTHCICYVAHNFGGAAKYVERAIKRGLFVKNFS